MNNPKVYFTISNVFNCLQPISWFLPTLNAAYYSKTEFLKNAASKYNEYTKNFVKENKEKSGEIYSSTKYSYDANTHLFNFEEINHCSSNDDFNELYEGKTLFDMNLSYNNMSNASEQVKMSIKKPGKNASLFETIKFKYACPETKDGFYVNSSNWNIIVRNILKGKNTLITGQTGCGKTSLVLKICELLKLKCRIYDMGQMIDPLTDLLGSHRIENGNSVFDYAKFVEDVQKPGVILLDELSRASALANNILFPCLDDRRMLPIEIADSKSDRVIKVHPKCVFIATANIGDEYVGTSTIDLALENRFLTVNIQEIPTDAEIELLQVKKEVTEQEAKNVINIASKIRELFNEGSIKKTVSTRDTLECAELVHDGFNIFDAIKYIFLEKFDDDDKSLVQKIIMGQ